MLTGLGAAGVLAGGGSILGATFIGPARTRAFAAMGVISGIGLALGPSLSGWLVDGLGWRFVFGIFTMPGIVLVAGTWLINETRTDPRPRIDWAGAATFVAGLAALVSAVMLGSADGWAAPEVLALFATVTIIFALFVLIEHRVVNPVLDLSLLRRRRFMGWLAAAMTVSAGCAGIFAFLPSYFHYPAGFTASGAGLVMILPALPMMILPAVGSRLVNHGVSSTLLISTALLTISCGNAALAILHPTIGASVVAGPLLLLGAGVGLALGIIDSQVMNEVSDEQVGMAAGILNTVRGATNALVLGLFGSALIAILAGKVGSTGLAGQVATGNIPATSTAQFLAVQLTDTRRVVLITAAVLCFTATIITAILVRGSAQEVQHAGDFRQVDGCR